MIALIDGDIIKYQAGFASDQKIYTLNGSEFEYKKDAQYHAKVHKLSEDDITVRAEAEPVEYCLSSVKKMIKSIMEAVDAQECRIFLTGKDNFREKVAVTLPYKGNRDDAHKPIHYQAIHDYLVNVWKAEVVDGQEADDMLSITQYTEWKHNDETNLDGTLSDTIICSVDKDLLGTPGFNYNWRNDEIKYVTLQEANNFFNRQLLTGDTVDNILGCGKREEATYKTGKKVGQTYMKRKGIGPKQAEKLLPIHKNEEEMYKEVKKQYDIVFKDDSERALREMADLLWIRRVENSNWQPPEIDDENNG